LANSFSQSLDSSSQKRFNPSISNQKTGTITQGKHGSWQNLKTAPLSKANNMAVTKPERIKKPGRKIAILFSDDSTLFFAVKMREQLLKADQALTIDMIWCVEENALSYRQMGVLLPEGPAGYVLEEDFPKFCASDKYYGIVTSRVYKGLNLALSKPEIRHLSNRPCIVSFLGGLDFFPDQGLANRRNCDGVYLLPKDQVDAFRKQMETDDSGWQDVQFGHPAFLHPAQAATTKAKKADADTAQIYFFAQAISPLTKRSRLHMLHCMAAMARANPSSAFWIKLRHLPHENRDHKHTEEFDYPSLMKSGDVPGGKPDNLNFTACTMDEALTKATLGITCTSTAAIDLIRSGIPTIVYTDYPDNYRDPLAAAMQGLFAGSGLLASIEDLLDQRAGTPDPEWLDNLFCKDELALNILDTMTRFHARPFQIQSR
jgi:hypothetical protein